ncbi:BLUF domain-containing protein [Hymenobacter chitinivorans]|uniref:FAD-dependent sensor of blue light n=1 Tax=Hymenobacter chitinivorans DSM 11115 TaxID=1121954 RepID=A0A2M9BP23_9BACT|nr:BLUF domain-containing protein [Hymenobacter chitinivorans]PJJ59695.1 FAD-dependent sensor of blue light [Hymenobacter chitinivorans DSM 11115]
MTTTPLYHLVYQSNVTAPLSETELEALLVQSRAWNHSHDLTGVLLYCDANIVQVLEGPQDEVEYIFGRIERDLRHYDVTKLADGPIQQRNFSQWSMGFKSVHPEDFMYLTGYVNPAAPSYPAQLVAETKASSLHELLAAFVTDQKIRY